MARGHAPPFDIGQNSVHIAPMQAVSYSEARENLKVMIDKVTSGTAYN